ncbi:MAG: glycosyl transferase family 2, partial [Actinomycetia bacterium]|nr:glycosyl transferase family 2 [Actinomycetes bacterium]
MEIKKYETALRDDILTWIKDIEKVDVLVGIPSFNSEDTIKKVIKEAIKGLVTYFPGKRKAILISDGGS